MTQAGPAIPVIAVTDRAADGGPALRVAVVADGRATEAGPARPVIEVSDGRPTQGNEPIPVVVATGAQASQVAAGPAIAVYVVSGSLSSGTAPANTVLPAITGLLATGETLTTTDGTWTGTAPITYTYQWNRSGVAIGGATASTYVVQAADIAATITVTVTATNAAGSASATSAGLSTILLDTFTGADTTQLGSHTPDIAPGGSSWAQTVATSFWLQSNALQPNRYIDGDLGTINAGVSDFSLQCVVTPVNNGAAAGYPAIVFRYSAANAFWYVQPDSANQRIQLYTVIAGAHAERIRLPFTLTSGVPVTIRIDCKGPDVTLWVNGVEQVTYVHTHNQSATTVGIRIGKSGAPAGRPVWEDLRVATYGGTDLNWPIFVKSGSNPIVPQGTAGAWDDEDVNNPNVVYDADNIRWALHYSGYDGDGSNVQDAGMAYSASLPGTWTKDAGNPVLSSIAEDGVYAFNGGLIKLGATWYLYYGSGSATVIRCATASDLSGPWTRQGIVLNVGAAGQWDETAVFDGFARVRQDGTTVELWYVGSSVSTRKIGYATSTDGLTFTKASANPVLAVPVWSFNGQFGEPSVYVPTGQEGTERLVSFDSTDVIATNRFISQAITLDDGATWHWRIKAQEKGTGWESAQNFDSFVLVDGGTMYLYYCGSDVNGAALGLNIQVGVASVAWSYSSLRAN